MHRTFLVNQATWHREWNHAKKRGRFFFLKNSRDNFDVCFASRYPIIRHCRWREFRARLSGKDEIIGAHAGIFYSTHRDGYAEVKRVSWRRTPATNDENNFVDATNCERIPRFDESVDRGRRVRRNGCPRRALGRASPVT